MADMTKLNLVFKDAAGKNLTCNFNYANKEAAASVRPLMEAMIANGAIYNVPPAVIVSATFVETVETPVSL